MRRSCRPCNRWGITAAIGLSPAKATLVNIVFSSRGLWNFLLIWIGGATGSATGRWEAGGKVMDAAPAGGGADVRLAIVLASLQRAAAAAGWRRCSCYLLREDD